MFKKEFIAKVRDNLKEQGVKREIKFPSHYVSIYNVDGSVKHMKFNGEVREANYSLNDVQNILNMVLDTIVDAIRDGEEVSLVGFGKFYSKEHKARRSIDPRNTSEWYDIPAYRVPKFQYGTNLKLAAKACELVQKDEAAAIELMPDMDEED